MTANYDAAMNGELRIGSKEQEVDSATLYLHPDDEPASKGKLLGVITPRSVAVEIVRLHDALRRAAKALAEIRTIVDYATGRGLAVDAGAVREALTGTGLSAGGPSDPLAPPIRWFNAAGELTGQPSPWELGRVTDVFLGQPGGVMDGPSADVFWQPASG